MGWREWIALPDLGIPAVKAKIDTGTRTSALHTFHLDPYRSGGSLRVRFAIHPLQRRTDIVIRCDTDVVNHRSVRDSGGRSEMRYVIATALVVGDVRRQVEVKLTSREDMLFRLDLIRIVGARAPGHQASGRHAGDRRRARGNAGRGQEHDRGLPEAQSRLPSAGVHQGSRRLGHLLLRRGRQGRGHDDARGTGGRVSLQSAPGRTGEDGENHARGTHHRHARGARHGAQRGGRGHAALQPRPGGARAQLLSGPGWPISS